MAIHLEKRLSEFQKTYTTSKRLLAMLWNVDKGLFLGSLFSVTIPAIIPFINAYIYKLIIDFIVSAAQGNIPSTSTLYFLLIARITTLFILEASISVQNYIDLLIWTNFPIHFYQVFLTKLSMLDIQYFEDSTYKDRLEKVRDSYAYAPINMLSSLFYMFQNLLQIAIALVVIATLNWILIVVVVITTLPSFINQLKFAKVSWGIWNSNSPYQKKFWYISELLQDGKSLKEIKIFQTAHVFLSELKQVYRNFVNENAHAAKRQLNVNLIVNFAHTITYLVIEVLVIFF